MGVNYEMYEEQFTLLVSIAEKLKKNHDNIDKSDRTGTGKYAKAYNHLRNQLCSETLKYACMGVRVGLVLDETLVKKANDIVTENFRSIWHLVCQCEFDELNNLLENMQQKYLKEEVFPVWEKQAV